MKHNEVPINREYGRSIKTYLFQGRQDGGKRVWIRRGFGGGLEFSFNYYVFLLFLIAM
jgi:hypothetical protein